MQDAPLAEALKAAFDDMPRQLQHAARWMLEHGDDVALLSMREQARRAGVHPVTLTRLAQRMGFGGYDEVRALYAARVRARPDSYRGRAEELLLRQRLDGDDALITDTMVAMAGHLRALAEPESIARLTAAADRIAGAERLFALGLRSSFPVAYMFQYIRSLFGATSALVDAPGGIGADVLRSAGKSDVLLAVTVKPYTQQTLDIVDIAIGRGVAIVGVTDSELSPLAKRADETILVATETPSFFHTMAPALAAVECLAALVATRKGDDAIAAIDTSEGQLRAGAYFPKRRRKR